MLHPKMVQCPINSMFLLKGKYPCILLAFRLKLISRFGYISDVQKSIFKPFNSPAVHGNWPLIVEVCNPVVGNPAGSHRQGQRACGVGWELPGQQDPIIFQHQVPMLARRKDMV